MLEKKYELRISFNELGELMKNYVKKKPNFQKFVNEQESKCLFEMGKIFSSLSEFQQINDYYQNSLEIQKKNKQF